VNKELARLQFYGAGPKAAIADDIEEDLGSDGSHRNIIPVTKVL
jgi:hypothetical protein